MLLDMIINAGVKTAPNATAGQTQALAEGETPTGDGFAVLLDGEMAAEPQADPTLSLEGDANAALTPEASLPVPQRPLLTEAETPGLSAPPPMFPEATALPEADAARPIPDMPAAPQIDAPDQNEAPVKTDVAIPLVAAPLEVAAPQPTQKTPADDASTDTPQPLPVPVRTGGLASPIEAAVAAGSAPIAPVERVPGEVRAIAPTKPAPAMAQTREAPRPQATASPAVAATTSEDVPLPGAGAPEPDLTVDGDPPVADRRAQQVATPTTPAVAPPLAPLAPSMTTTPVFAVPEAVAPLQSEGAISVALGDTPLGERGNPIQGLASPIPVAKAATLPQFVAHQLVAQLRQDPTGPYEIRLDPPELGRVVVRMVAGEGGMVAQISAERQDVLDLLRKNEADLARDFAQSGFEDLAFSFASDSGAQDETADDDQTSEGASSVTLADASPASAPVLGQTPHTGRLDIRL